MLPDPEHLEATVVHALNFGKQHAYKPAYNKNCTLIGFYC